jgi:pheromone shutdown protein TraB
MIIFSTHTLPTLIDEITDIEKRQHWFNKISQFPGIFVLEMVGILLIMVCTYVAGEWAFNIGFSLTSSM